MSEKSDTNEMARKMVTHQIPGMDAVVIHRDVVYAMRDDVPLTMDIYMPPGSKNDVQIPAVIIVTGYPDPGFAAFVGCPFKNMGSSVSWGRLIAASGLAAITYTNREPVSDLEALLNYVSHSAATLGIDACRMALWASSGNVPLLLWQLMTMPGDRFKCAVMCYGYTLDIDEATGVIEAAAVYRFANPNAGKSIDDLPQNVALLMIRAGRDEMPHLNDSLDRFACTALARNLPITIVNLPSALHAFDLLQKHAETDEAIDGILRFLQMNLKR